MKKLIIILSLIIINTITFAQTTIFFQAVAKDNSNNLAVNKSIFIQTSILDNATSASSLLTEQFSATTDSYGMFGISIGGGTRIGGTFNNIQSIDWSIPNRHLNIKVSFATTMPSVNDPSWVNMGTSAFGVVPYALYSGTSGGSLGAQDLLDSIKLKLKASDTLSLSNRINQKLHISDTAGMLSKYYNKTTTDAKLALKLSTTDTASLSNRINNEVSRATGVELLKLNISDTATMLSKYYNKTTTDNKLGLKLNATDTASLSNRINNEVVRATDVELLKLNISDTATMLSKYYNKTTADNKLGLKLNATDTASLSNRINNEVVRATDVELLKLNISDTATMLSKYYNKTTTDAKLALKLSTTDTATLSNRINLKLNISDTATMLSSYYNKTTTDAKLALKLSTTDTASLSNRINLKLNISDTASMLSKYYNKTTADSKLGLKLNATDTGTLSNRINLKLNISDTASMLSKYYNKSITDGKLDLKLNAADTASMLSNYYNKSIVEDKLDLKLNISDTATMLSNRIGKDTVSLSNRINAISTNVNAKHTLGESFGGGIIVYLESDNQHGIIVATQDGYFQNAQALPWVPNGTSLNYIGARKDGLYSGKVNTERIINTQTTGTSGSAATFIGNLSLNNYGDWHLPSRVELQKVIDYSKANPSVLPMNGGLYWSSTEVDNSNAYALSLTTQAAASYKTNSHIIRAIRTF